MEKVGLCVIFPFDFISKYVPLQSMGGESRLSLVAYGNLYGCLCSRLPVLLKTPQQTRISETVSKWHIAGDNNVIYYILGSDDRQRMSVHPRLCKFLGAVRLPKPPLVLF